MAAPVVIVQAAPQIIAAQPAAASVATQPAATQSAGTSAAISFAALVQQAGKALEGAQTSGTAKSAAVNGTDAEMATLLALLTHEVTPAEASQLLDQIDASPELELQLQAGTQGNGDQLKQQLNNIIATGIPKPVQEILADANNPQVEAAALPIAALAQPEAAQATLGVAAQRVLHFLSKTLAKKTPETASEELPQDAIAELNVASAMNPALMLLAAGPFPAAKDAAEPEEAVTEQPVAATESSAYLVTAMIPLAQQAVVAAPAEAAGMKDSTAVQSIDINARIPSLTLTDKTDTQALPQVILPGEVEKAIDTAKASPVPAAFQDLAAQATEGNALPKQAIKEVNASALHALHPAAANTHAPTAMVEAAPLIATTGAVNHAPVTDQVSVAIRQANTDGIEKITVQLDPVELGRVEVNLHIGKDGHTSVTFLIDKPETFDALSRDARHLERSLQEAGIKADTGGMQFNLRQQPQPQQFPGDTNGNGTRQHDSHNDVPGSNAASDKVVQLTPPSQNYRINIHEGLDIRA